MGVSREILIKRAGGDWQSPAISGYLDETHLQNLLAASPSRVPGVPEGSYAVTELPLDIGYADVVVVSPAGDLTVVECKLEKNPEKRRMVIGQVQDYASAIWRGGFDDFSQAWARRGAPLEHSLDAVALASLRSNIAAARINLCLAVDSIDDDLRRLVEYLSLITVADVTVTAIEVGYVRDGDTEILLPAVYGVELAEAKTMSKGSATKWTRESFLAATRSDAERAAAEFLLERAEASATAAVDSFPTVQYGKLGSGGVRLCPYGVRRAPISLWFVASQLTVWGQWQSYDDVPHPEGYAAIAAFLGQDHRQKPKAVPLTAVDLDGLWTAACESASAANGRNLPSAG